MYDVAIVGGGPAGASCAAFCAAAGLRVVVLEREQFPREKVCGDCINPACWGVLERLGVSDAVRALPHGALDEVEFIAIDGRAVHVGLPGGDNAEIAVKRSALDAVLLDRARACGAEVRENSTVTALNRADGNWRVTTAEAELAARFVVGADGRNSTIARIVGLLPRNAKDRVALQAHLPMPQNFGRRVVLQFLPDGYSGQAPVNDTELNVCLVGRADSLQRLRTWAATRFALAADPHWRTITPLTRDPISPAHRGLLLVGDAARVVEPFTGEGIFYALRSGELAAESIVTGADYTRPHRDMYRGRLWINRLARAAVTSPRIGSTFVHAARFQPALLRLLTAKITKATPGTP